MMRLIMILIAIFWFNNTKLIAQSDSGISQLRKIPGKYLHKVNQKVQKYDSRVSKKIEKTLVRLSRWESKLKKIIEKVDPSVASKLFGSNQITFSSLLSKVKAGKLLNEDPLAGYSRYVDKLGASVKFISVGGNIADSIVKTKSKKCIDELNELQHTLANEQYIEEFIRERKNQITEHALKVISRNKLLGKMNKEAYYYVQTIRNYKQLFANSSKIEEAAFDILKSVAGFESFSKSQSPLNSVFGGGGLSSMAMGNASPVISGLVSRKSLQEHVNLNIPTLAQTDISTQISKMLPDIKPQLDNLRKRFSNTGGMENSQMPSFIPNSQKSKLFWQRLEYGFDLQFGKSINFLPATSDISAKIGYKMNDKSIIGLGINYKLGLGRGWNKIRLSNEGVGFRTFLKWKISKLIDVQGGAEWNYLSSFKKLEAFKSWDKWQQSALLGLSKSYKINKKMKGNFQAMYDFLHANHRPVSSPFVFRMGYDF